MAKKKDAKQDACAGEVMLVNDVAGEECRIAILRDGILEELFTERAATATSVGNIYKGRVSNVESAIQAAFVDYGQAQRGFLHISDLHPRYFPGGDASEKVGKKTSRRDRPLIQQALKRGDEILVQVLKEGIGTKGPTLTAYLSIPGRLMVMMPYMDKVGVTRRVEDEVERKAMRKVLDTLDLPDDFGFILRTAGMGQTKRELKRDVAYLTRMWKVMEKRINKTGVPAELYTESDLVLRTVRDVLRPEIKAIVVDSEDAADRVRAFLNVIAPRSAPPVIHYHRPMPLFHAFNVERQIETIHAREVDLPSGGRLVIDQTEALVAIDVNSGRSRSAKDSETNAYRTNLEAVTEIARQLRLRDLGGLVIHDLIDMRQRSRRKEVFEKFRDLLKADRAKTTILPISDFGILEMTRQRMRPSIRMANYVECPACSGHGEVKAPDMVAADAVREIGYLLHCEETAKLEVVVSPRVASALLSTKRRVLDLIEDRMGKPVDVRVSESIPVDRVVYYAYDARGTDLDLEKLTPGELPGLDALMAESDAPAVAETESGGGRGRSRRRRKSPPADAAAIALSGEFQRELEALDAEAEREEEAERGEEAEQSQERKPAGRKRRRRNRRRKPAPLIESPSRLYVLAKAMGVTSKQIIMRWEASGGEKNTGFQLNSHMSRVTPEQASTIQAWFARDEEPAPVSDASSGTEQADTTAPKKPRRRRRRGGKSSRSGADAPPSDDAAEPTASEGAPEETPAPRRRRSRGTAGAAASDAGGEQVESTKEEKAPSRKKRRRRSKPAAQTDSVVETKEDAAAKPGRKKRAAKKAKAKQARPSGKEAPSESKPADDTAAEPAPAKPRRRTLYGNRRKLSPGEAESARASESTPA
ncbi:MAG: Rne/Rng family ribonuclease [Phycisphaerales bacterium]|nr:Rne/Rng family ribonuclease [Phycisphaerales bacterium]